MSAVACVFALGLAGCSSRARTAGNEPRDKTAPNFSLRDADGKSVQLSDYRGKVVLLNFWATWCGPCRIEIPWFVDFERQYKDRGFAVIGVSMDEEGWSAIKPFTSEVGVNYRILLGDSSIAEKYGGVDSLPTTFLIDREGRIVSTHIGLVGRSKYENEIKQLLGGSPRAGRRGGAGLPPIFVRSR